MDTKSKNAVEVAVAPPNDALLLVTVCPEEVWRLILGNVDNASDYLKICRASPALQEWLSDHRVEVLIEPVMSILIEKKFRLVEIYHSSGNDTTTTSESEEESDEVQVSAYRNEFHYLAKFRLVCRRWKVAVDRYLQGLFCTDELINESSHRPFYILNFFCKKFRSAEDFQKFDNHFLSTHFSSKANPFPTQKVDIHFVGHNISELFYNSSGNMLRHYGRHTHVLCLEINILEAAEQFRFYLELKEMLCLVPTLKVLQCKFRYESSVLDEAQVNQLVSIYREAILPPDIHTLFMNGCNYPVRLLKQLMLRAPKTLTYLYADGHVDNRFPFPLQFDGHVRHPLTKLWLSMQPHFTVSKTEIFTALETLCGDTLIDLRLELPLANPAEVVPPLKLSKLKKLYLVHCGSVGPLDFLWGVAGSLETLEVDLEAIGTVELDTVELQSMLKLISQRKELVKSNVWQLLPRLQSVKVEFWADWELLQNICTRAEYEASMTQQQQQ